MEVRPSAQHAVVEFDASVYSVEAIKRAAYRMLNQFSADVSVRDGRVVCALSLPANCQPGPVIDEFRKEVLDQDLRERISKETAPLRNAILALAFSSSALQGRE
jgi:His-Xaa-Ser system protein HxsD